MRERPMRASDIADQCLLESGARGLSHYAKEVALTALLVAPDGAISMRAYRRRIKETFLQTHPECGSFFVIFVLPVLISLISNWIAKWIINRTDMKEIRGEAFDALIDSSPRWMDTLTSTSSTQRNPAGRNA
jgi:hypothetical protein